jgi:hypothetical protein
MPYFCRICWSKFYLVDHVDAINKMYFESDEVIKRKEKV